MSDAEKVAAFDSLAAAMTNKFSDDTWGWFCACPGGGEAKWATRAEAVADLIAWAKRVKPNARTRNSGETIMSEPSRYSSGGFSPRFIVTRADRKPCRESARYMVLDGSGADPHAVVALRAYADSVRGENPTLAADLDALLVTGNWPAELAQHKDAK